MTKTFAIAASAFLIGCAVSAASAGTGWHVFASGNGTGTYRAFANASADASRSHALAVRVTSSPGKPVKVAMLLTCEEDMRVMSGTIVVATTWLFNSCSLAAEVRTDYPGPLRVELLRR